MAADDNEEKRLRSVALRNANSILLARQRAERELIEAKEALERKTAELAQSLAMMRATLEATTDGILVTNASGEVTGFNRNFVEMWRLPSDAMDMGQHRRLLDLSAKEFSQPESFRARIEEIYATSPPESFDVLELADGRVVERFSKIQFVEERNVGRVWSFRDVTERRRAEIALRESEDRLRAVFNQAAVGMATAGLDGRFEQVNQRFSEILGYSAQECRNLTFMDVTYPDDLDQTQANVRRLIAGEISNYALEKRYIRKDGTVIWSLTSVTLVKDAVGRPQRFISAIEDISQSKDAQEALRESEEMHRVFFELGSVGMAYVSPEGRFLKVNEKYCEITGYGREELAQLTPIALTHPDDRRQERERAAQYLRDNLPVHKSERRYVRKDGSVRWVSVAARMVHGPHGSPRYSIGIVEDITERKQAEAELQAADRKKDEFLAILAHELRNPLAPIRNGLKVLMMAGNNSIVAENARSLMDQALNQMVRLVDDLLDASRITTGKLQLRKERVELAAVVQSAVETSRPLIDERAHILTITLPPAPILLEADFTRLAQVFSNLLNNAAKYSEPGGRIRLSAERNAHEILVRISDTGIGIPAGDLPHVFEMFTQVDTALERSQGGLGIGLSLVKGLVDMHGGAIEVRSEGPGRGSEFVVRLPVVKMDALPGAHPADADRKSSFAGRWRVLVIDDNRLSAESAAMALRLMGHEINTAYDGIEGIEVAKTFKPDVILLDIGLPKLSGYETARRIRQQSWGESVILIAVTGYGQDEDRQRALAAGFDYHMVKPVNFGELEQKLSEMAPEVKTIH